MSIGQFAEIDGEHVEYDYGGDADCYVDFMTGIGHYATEAVLKALGIEYDPTEEGTL